MQRTTWPRRSTFTNNTDADSDVVEVVENNNAVEKSGIGADSTSEKKNMTSLRGMLDHHAHRSESASRTRSR
jgi:hypothetical protein